MPSEQQNWYENAPAPDEAAGRRAPRPPRMNAASLNGSAYPPARRRRVGLWLPFLVFLVLAAAVVIPLAAGLNDGQRDREAFLQSSAEDHYRRALGYEADNYPELALAELQLSLRFDPNYAPARARLVALQNKLAPSGTPAPSNVADQLYKQASDSMSKQAWDDAIGELEELHRVSPEYKTAEVAQLLFQAYMGGGKRAVAANNVELARQRFESAVELQPNDATAKQQRDLARLYLAGQQNAGYDWGLTVSSYQQVYNQDPNYADVKKQLVNALLKNADLAITQGAWCIAARDLDKANQLAPMPSLAANAQTAQTNCRNAILTPTAAPTVTPSAGATPPPTAVPANAELYRAQVRVESGCGGVPGILGHVKDAANNPLPNVSVRYTTDFGLEATVRTDANGYYSFVLGKDAGKFHVVVLAADNKTPASQVIDVDYPGGSANGCRQMVDWTKS